MLNVSVLKGQTIVKILKRNASCDAEWYSQMKGEKKIISKSAKVYSVDDSDEVNCEMNKLVFITANGNQYTMDHHQDCCESVYLADICGELSDLIDTPIIEVEEVINDDATNYYVRWTFYKFQTSKGFVTLRWYGESNGCYAVDVDFNIIS